MGILILAAVAVHQKFATPPPIIKAFIEHTNPWLKEIGIPPERTDQVELDSEYKDSNPTFHTKNWSFWLTPDFKKMRDFNCSFQENNWYGRSKPFSKTEIARRAQLLMKWMGCQDRCDIAEQSYYYSPPGPVPEMGAFGWSSLVLRPMWHGVPYEQTTLGCSMRFYVVAGIPETAGYFEEVRPRPEQMLKKEFREEDAELFILNNMLSKKYDQNLDLLVESGPIISYPVIDDGHKWFEMGKKVRYYISVDCWYGNERQVWYFDPETGKHVAIHNWGEQFGRIEGLREGLSQGEKVQIYEVGKWHQWRVRDAQQVLEIPKNLEPVILRAYRWMGRAFKDKNDGSIYTAIYGHYIRFDISENLLQNLVTSSASKQVE